MVDLAQTYNRTPHGEKVMPPFVKFEWRAEEDREQTLATGGYASRDVPFAVIIPSGGTANSQVEKNANDWIAQLKARNDQFAEFFETMFDKWKKGNSLDMVDGEPLRTWTGINPGQLETCSKMGVFSIEALAQATETQLQALGMGARTLRDKARNWLQQKNDGGKILEKLSALEVKLNGMETELKSKDEVIKELRGQLSQKEPVAVTRKRNLGLAEKANDSSNSNN
jgi:hypothetical protein